MSGFILYLFKVALSLSAVYLFYQLVLRRLTFYTWNRWYLLVYTALSFFIPLINISPLLQRNALEENAVVQYIYPVNAISINTTEVAQNHNASLMDSWDWMLVVFLSGFLVVMLRLLVQYVSYLKMKRKAELIADDKIKIYQLADDIGPFSFGNTVFINQHLHNEAELKEIIRHEFVHIRQKHTIDIIWSEVFCMLNWFNPFAWLLRHSVRQNLEFIADNKVIKNGLDKKQYQYLLLKVIGTSRLRITNQFNFSSLKKRIVMMNKIESAKVHLLKFLFVLPLIAVGLVAFRNLSHTALSERNFVGLVIDIGTHQPLSGVRVKEEITGKEAVTDARGYYSLLFSKNDIGPEIEKYHFLFNKEGYAEMYSSAEIKFEQTIFTNHNYVELIGMKTSPVKEDRWGCFSIMNLKHEGQATPVSYTEALEVYTEFLAQPYSPNSREFFERNTQVQNLVWQTEPQNIAVIYLKNGEVEKYKINNVITLHTTYTI